MIAKKILKMMAEIEEIKPAHTITTRKGSYNVRLSDPVLNLMRPKLIENQLAIVPVDMDYRVDMFPLISGAYNTNALTTVKVKYKIIDAEDNETLEVVSIGSGADTNDKGSGMAATYALKNLLVKLVLAPGEKDTDEDPSEKAVDEILRDRVSRIIVKIRNSEKLSSTDKDSYIDRVQQRMYEPDYLDKAEKWLDESKQEPK